MLSPGPQLQSQLKGQGAEMPLLVIVPNIRSRTQKCPCPIFRLNKDKFGGWEFAILSFPG